MAYTHRTEYFGNVKNESPDFLRKALLHPYAAHLTPPIFLQLFYIQYAHSYFK